MLPAVAQLPCRAVLLRRLRPRLHPLDRPRLDNPHRALSVRILTVEHHQHALDHLRAVAVRQHRAQPRAAVDVAALLPLLAPQRPSRRRGARTEDLQRRQRSQRADDRVRVLVRRHRRPALAHDGAHRVVRALRVVAHLPQQRAHERGALLGVAQLVDELGVLRGDRAAGLRPERRVRRAQDGAAVRGARQYLPAGTEHVEQAPLLLQDVDLAAAPAARVVGPSAPLLAALDAHLGEAVADAVGDPATGVLVLEQRWPLRG